MSAVYYHNANDFHILTSFAELALFYCPLPEGKTAPNLHFFSAVSDTSAIVHLYEKQFLDSLWPIVHRSPQQEECSMTKTNWIEKV